MAKSCEEIYISRVESGIRSIKLGTKTPNEAQVGLWLNKLKPLNDGMFFDLFEKYSKQLKEYEKNKHKMFGIMK
jgi:hypothetical protein